MISASIVDICQRVFGATAQVTMTECAGTWCVRIQPVHKTDPLTQSQQEMDVIMSLQHLLQGAAVKLEVV
jgi:hypothetical protein